MTRQLFAKLIISALILALIITSLVWINSLTQFSDNPSASHQVDTFLVNTTMEQFSADGTLSKTTQAHFIKHFLKVGSSEFVSPTITLYSKNSPPWKITALTGKSLQDNQLIELDGHVIAFQAASNNASSTTIRSNQLFYNVKTKMIYTDTFVTILRQQSITQAQGLTFDLNTNRMILKSHMITHFSPTTINQF